MRTPISGTANFVQFVPSVETASNFFDTTEALAHFKLKLFCAGQRKKFDIFTQSIKTEQTDTYFDKCLLLLIHNVLSIIVHDVNYKNNSAEYTYKCRLPCCKEEFLIAQKKNNGITYPDQADTKLIEALYLYHVKQAKKLKKLIGKKEWKKILHDVSRFPNAGTILEYFTSEDVDSDDQRKG